MNTDIGQFIGILANICVSAGIIFLAVELHQNNRLLGAWRPWFNGKGQSPVPIKEAWKVHRVVLNPDFVRFFEEQVLGRDAPESGTR